MDGSSTRLCEFEQIQRFEWNECVIFFLWGKKHAEMEITNVPEIISEKNNLIF